MHGQKNILKIHVFCKYWPDDGTIRPKLEANTSIITQYYVIILGGVFVQFVVLTTLRLDTPAVRFNHKTLKMVGVGGRGGG
jgi:hypothetical protein